MQQAASGLQVSAPVLPPPTYHHSAPSGGHNLPALADLTQGAPSNHHQPLPYNTHPPPQAPGHSLPGLGQPIQQQSSQAFLNRERDMREQQEIRERGTMGIQRQQEEMVMRERETRERMEREHHLERMHREQQQQQQLQHPHQHPHPHPHQHPHPHSHQHQQQQQARQQHPQHPVQNHTGSIPIHQPVASKVPNSIHGPNGLLSNVASGPGPAVPTVPPSSAGGNIFGMSAHRLETAHRPIEFMPQAGGHPVQQTAGFIGPGGGPGPSTMQTQAVLGQGQQPILNVSSVDAFSPLVYKRIYSELFTTRCGIVVFSPYLEVSLIYDRDHFACQSFQCNGCFFRRSSEFSGCFELSRSSQSPLQ